MNKTLNTILNLMSVDLNDNQMIHLKNVLETVLKFPSTIPNDQLIERFSESKRIVGIKNSSIAQYVFELKTMLKYVTKNLAEFTTADIKTYLITYRKEHQISLITVRNKIHYLSAFYEFLIDEQMIEYNPTRGIRKILVDKVIKHPYKPQELSALCEACKTTRDRAIIEFLNSTCCRVSEMTGLNVKDVDFKLDQAVVFGKGHKERTVFINKSAHKWLKKYLKERNAKPDEPLFVGKTGLRLSVRSVEKMLSKTGDRAGVAKTHPHRFHRTAATNLRTKGKVPLDILMKILGHSDVKTTMIYVDSGAEEVKAVYNSAQEALAIG